MTSAPTGDRQPDQRVVLVVDLDGAPLTVLAVLEELLRDLVAWEESDAADPPQTREALRLPAPLAGGVALAAVRRLAAALGPTSAWAGSGAGCWPSTAAPRILRCRC